MRLSRKPCASIAAFFRRISCSRDQTVEEICKWNVIALLLFPCQCQHCKLRRVNVRRSPFFLNYDDYRNLGTWTDSAHARTFTTLHLERLCVNTDFLLNTAFSDLEAVLDLSPALLNASLWLPLHDSAQSTSTCETAQRNADVYAVEDLRTRPLLPIDAPIELLQKMAHLEKCKAMLNPETSSLTRSIKDAISSRRGSTFEPRAPIHARGMLKPFCSAWGCSPDGILTPRAACKRQQSYLNERAVHGYVETNAESSQVRRRLSENTSLGCRRLSPVIPEGLSAIVQQSRYDRVLLCPTPIMGSGRTTEGHLQVPVSGQQRRTSSLYSCSSVSFEQAPSEPEASGERAAKRARSSQPGSIPTRVTASSSPASGESDFSSESTATAAAFAGRGARGEPYASRRHLWWSSQTQFIFVYLLSVLDVQHTVIIPISLIQRKTLALPSIFFLVKLVLKTPLDVFLLSLHQMLQQGLCGTLDALHPRLRVFGLFFTFILPMVHVALETRSEFTLMTSIESLAFYTTRLLPRACTSACFRTSFIDERDGCVKKTLFCWEAPPPPPENYDISLCGEGPRDWQSNVDDSSLCNRVMYHIYCEPRDRNAVDQFKSGCVPNPRAWAYEEKPMRTPETLVYGLFVCFSLAPLFFSHYHQSSNRMQLTLFMIGLGLCALGVATVVHGFLLKVPFIYAQYIAQTATSDWVSPNIWMEACILAICSIGWRLPVQARIASMNPPFFHAGQLALGMAGIDAAMLVFSLCVMWLLQYGLDTLAEEYTKYEEEPSINFDVQFPRLWPMLLENLNYSRCMMGISVFALWVMSLGWKMGLVENAVAHVQQLKALKGTSIRIVIVLLLCVTSFAIGSNLEVVITVNHWLGARGLLSQWGVILFVLMLIAIPCHKIQMRWGSRRAKGLMYSAIILAVAALLCSSLWALGLSLLLLLLAAVTGVVLMTRHVEANAQLDRLARAMSVHSPTVRAAHGRRVSYAASTLPKSESSVKMETVDDGNSSSRERLTCEVSQVSDLCTIDVRFKAEDRRVNLRHENSPEIAQRKNRPRLRWRARWRQFKKISIALPIRLLFLGGTEIMRISLQHMFETSLDESSPLGLFLVPASPSDEKQLSLSRSRSAFPSREASHRLSPSRFVKNESQARGGEEVEIDKRSWRPVPPKTFSSPFSYYDWPLTRRNRAQLKPLQDTTRTSWRTGAASLGIWWSYAMRFLLFPAVLSMASWELLSINKADEAPPKIVHDESLAGRPLNFGMRQRHLPDKMDVVILGGFLLITMLLVIFPKLLGFLVPSTRRTLAIITETTDEPPRFEAVRKRHEIIDCAKPFCGRRRSIEEDEGQSD